jgi:hypothetical protein
VETVHFAATDSGATARCEFIDLDATVDRKGWAPRFRVVDSSSIKSLDVDSSSSILPPSSGRLSWYHALCPTVTDELLLSMCELIVEAALTAPSLPGSASDPSASEVQRLAEAYPWSLAANVAQTAPLSPHVWSNAPEQVVLVRPTDEPDFAYEEPYPRAPIVDRSKEPLALWNISIAEPEEARHAHSHRSKRSSKYSRSKRRQHSEQKETDGDKRMTDGAAVMKDIAVQPIAAQSLPTATNPAPPAAAVGTAAPPVAPTHTVHPSRLGRAGVPTDSSVLPRTEINGPSAVPSFAAPANASGPSAVELQIARAKEAIRRSGLAVHLTGENESKAPSMPDRTPLDKPPSHASSHPSSRGSSRSRSVSRSPRRRHSSSRKHERGRGESRSRHADSPSLHGRAREDAPARDRGHSGSRNSPRRDAEERRRWEEERRISRDERVVRPSMESHGRPERERERDPRHPELDSRWRERLPEREWARERDMHPHVRDHPPERDAKRVRRSHSPERFAGYERAPPPPHMLMHGRSPPRDSRAPAPPAYHPPSAAPAPASGYKRPRDFEMDLPPGRGAASYDADRHAQAQAAGMRGDRRPEWRDERDRDRERERERHHRPHDEMPPGRGRRFERDERERDRERERDDRREVPHSRR